MVKVSVIIPVYNTGEYLRQCLDSIVNQTLNDIEIICVNDGSTDNSLDILEEYQKSDSRIKIFSQENSGLSATRNNGFKHASGKYVYFMDSDDTLELDSLNDLYELCEEKSLDIVIFKLINVEEGTGRRYSERYYNMPFLKQIVGDEVFSYEDVGEKLYDLAVSSPGKFFKSELISDIKFPVGLIFEDNPFFIEAFFKAKRVYFYDEYLYNRLRRQSSITTNYDLSFADSIPISNRIIEISKKYGHYDEFKDKIFNKKIFRIYDRYTSVGESYKQDFFREMKNDFTSFKEEIEDNINLDEFNQCVFQNVLIFENYEDFNRSIESYKDEKNKLRMFKRNEISRIDMKNYGTESNYIMILNNSDSNSTEYYYDWFINEKGSGIVVESDSGELDLELKMVRDGKFKLWLRSIDIKDEKDNKVKCCIDYTSFIVNGEEHLSNHNPYWHEEPYSFSKKVKDSEIINIHIEWITYEKMELLVNDFAELNRKHNRLTKQSFKLMNKINKRDNKNKKLKKELNEVYSSRSWKITEPLRKIRNR
jgi:glycosyltransferase involved in cell wall biosynthesis